jgi:salicylate hydroxylase
LYESAAAFSEIGAGVSFGPNALEAMRLLSPSIEDAYKRRATSNGWHEKRRNWFEFRIGMKEDGWKDMKAPGREGQRIAQTLAGEVGQCSVHRAHFLEELVKLIPSGVAYFGKRVENVEKKGSRMLLTFTDGSTSEADGVIGSDGVKSRTRQILFENGPFTNPTFTGKYAYRGLIPMKKAVDAIGDELARNSQMYLGHHSHILSTYVILCSGPVLTLIIAFPIEKGNTMNVVAFHTKSDGVWNDEQWVLKTQKEDMLKDFEEWGDNVRDILSVCKP